jgi:hypothetical protein
MIRLPVPRRLLRSIVVAAALGCAPRVLAAQAYAISVEQLARSSDAVIRGKVVGARAHSREDGRIFTTYEVRTARVLRGRAPPTARVIVPGGVLGSIGQRVDGAPELAVGEELVLFLRRAGADGFVVAELTQGKFSVAGARARPDLSRVLFVRTSVPSGERRSEEMTVSELERRVRNVR